MSREEQLRQLALEELAKEELENEEKQKAQKPLAPSELPTGLSPKDMVVSTPEAMRVEGQQAQDFGLGAVEGIPFAKDVASGVEALYSTGTQNFGEAYTRNRQAWDKSINEAEERNPGAFMAGEITSGLVTPIKGIKGALAFGALSSASRLEDRNPFEMAKAGLEGAAITGAVGAGLGAASYAVNKVGEKLGILASFTTKEAVGALAGKDVVKLNRHIRKTGNPKATDIDNTVDFANRLLKTEVNGEPLMGGLTGQSFSRTAEKAKIARQNHGENLGKIVDQLDELAEPIDSNLLFSSMKNKLNLDDKLRSPDPDTVEYAQGMLQRLKTQFMDEVEEVVPMVVKKPMLGNNGQPVLDGSGKPFIIEEVVDTVKKSMKFKKLTPREIHQMKIDHSSTSSKVASGFEKLGDAQKQRLLSATEEFDTTLSSILNESMDRISEKAAKTNPDLVGAYRNVNRDYSDMLMVEQIAQSQADKQGGGVMERIKRGLGVRGLLVAQVSATTGANLALSASAGAVLNEVIQDPKTPVKMANSLKTLSDHIKTFPESSFLKRIIVAAQVASFDPSANEGLDKALASSASEISLMNMPVKRSLNDLKNKSDDVLQALEYHDPETASLVRQALDDNDDESLRALMDQASKNPKMSKYFEQGSGIDGRVFSEEDKAMYRTQIEKANIPLKDKLILKNQLDSNGSIPQFPQPEDRTLKYMKRDKSKPMF